MYFFSNQTQDSHVAKYHLSTRLSVEKNVNLKGKIRQREICNCIFREIKKKSWSFWRRPQFFFFCGIAGELLELATLKISSHDVNIILIRNGIELHSIYVIRIVNQNRE